MDAKVAVNEVFSIRDGEATTIVSERPELGRWLAVQARSVTMPDGPREGKRQSDGAPVEMAVIVAAQINTEGRWQWANLSVPTKEAIGDLLFDNGADKDRWYFACFNDPKVATRQTKGVELP